MSDEGLNSLPIYATRWRFIMAKKKSKKVKKEGGK